MSELEICLSDTEFLAGKPLPYLRAAIDELRAAAKDFLEHALDHCGTCDTCRGAAARLRAALTK